MELEIALILINKFQSYRCLENCRSIPIDEMIRALTAPRTRQALKNRNFLLALIERQSAPAGAYIAAVLPSYLD